MPSKKSTEELEPLIVTDDKPLWMQMTADAPGYDDIGDDQAVDDPYLSMISFCIILNFELHTLLDKSFVWCSLQTKLPMSREQHVNQCDCDTSLWICFCSCR
eukprot:m.57815 g.57815  ORF g.57815 m.57815 type:complete len:102 (+) comp15622_c0_seq5:129-434(+)